MGLLYRISIRLLYFAVFFALLVYPDLPPRTTFPFERFEIPSPRELKGALEPNYYLDQAEHLLNGQIYGPECLILRNNEIYTGLHGGEVIKLTDNHVTHVTKLGSACEDIVEEAKCGRPLGLAFDANKDNLIIADAYYGIWQVNLTSGVKTLLVSPNEVLPGKKYNRKAKFFNGVTVDKIGNIYWTDSSSDFLLQDLIYISLANPSGRVFKYDRKRNQNVVLVDELFFPNGVVISPNEEFLVVAETGAMMLTKYYLKGEKAGKSEVFIDGLPGLPDNLTPDEDGIWVPLVMSVDHDHPNGFIIFSRFPLLRLFFTRFLTIFESAFKVINDVYPNRMCQRFIHFIGHGESFKFLSPKRSTIIRLDWNGNIVGSLHGFDGSTGGISHVLPYKNDLLLGSPFNHYLTRVKSPNPNKPSRVRITNVRHSGIELESPVDNVQKDKLVSSTPENPSTPTPKSKETQPKIMNSKAEPGIIDNSVPIVSKDPVSDQKVPKKKNTENLRNQPAPIKEEIKVDTKPPKTEKLKIINKEGKHVEL